MNISQPVPPGSTDFAPPPPMWNATQDLSMVSGVPPPPTVVLENEETRKKKEAAIAEEKRNQRLALEKQRDDCRQRATALSRELEMLRNQRKDLTSSKRSPSPTTMNFIRENDKLQAAIQEKLSTIKNVIEMLSDIIGKDTSKSGGDKTLSSEKPKKESSSKKEDKKSRKNEKSPVKSREKEKVKEIKESNGVFNVVHYDPELHWCQLCNVFPKTAKDYLNHLHSNEHKVKQALDQPWREKFPSDDFPSHPDAPTKRTPIRGLQFFVPATAWFCKLCDVWMGDLHCASVHLKSKKHASEFGKILQKAPNFEIDFATERQRALDMSDPHVQMQGNSASAGNTFLESIPLQLKNSKPEMSNAVENLMEKVMKKIEPKRISPDPKTNASHKTKRKGNNDSKDDKKKKRKRKHSSSSSSSDSSSSSSSESSSSSSSSSSSDDSDDENKKKIDPIAIVRKLQTEALAKREKEVNKVGGWTSVPQSAIESRRLTKPKSPPPPPERPKVNMPGPKIIEFTDKTREKRNEHSSTSARSHGNDSRNNRNDSKSTRSTTSSRRPRTPEKRDRDKDRAKTTLKIDPSKSSKNAPTPLEKSKEARSREPSKRSESKKDSGDDDKKKLLNKKLPFIGRMPVFKKQQAMEKEEQKNKEEAQFCDMDMSNDCDDLMPDPMQYAFLNAPPPPPPPQVYQMSPETNVAQHSYPAMSHHAIDEEICPPGITQEEHDSIPQPISEAPPRKGPLPKDFQEALNILFDGAKPPSPIPVPEPPEETEQTYVYDPDAPTMLTHEDLSRHSFHEQSNFNEIILPDSLPPPQQQQQQPKTNNNKKHVNNNQQKVVPVPPEPTKAQIAKQQMDEMELAMLGIDASDLAAQCMYK